MRPVLIVLLLTLLGAPAARAAGLPDDLTIPDNFDCRQTFANYGPTGMPSWVVADRGRLRFHTDSKDYAPTYYDYDDSWVSGEPTNGAWSWSDAVAFDGGPLARQAGGWPTISGRWYRRGRVMPHDDVRGRSAQLVLRSGADGAPGAADEPTLAPAVDGQEGADGLQRSYWYCGKHGLQPRRALKGQLRWVRRTSGIRVRLPTWFEPLSQERPTRERGRVRAARKGLYRFEIVQRGCGNNCPSLGIFSAKRAPASELAHRRPVKLGRGIRGWVGNVGCGYSPGPDWGPVFCGREVIVWHAHGINRAIEKIDGDDAELIRYARQSVRYG